MKKLVFYVSLAVMVALVTGSAYGASIPSSKAAASIGELTALGRACSDEGPVPDPPAACPDGSMEDTGWVTVQRTFIKTPNGKELSFDAALQCGLVTFTQVKSKGGDKDGAQAEARIAVRIKITNLASGSLDPIPGSVHFAIPLGDDGSSDTGVTYCHRLQRLEAVFQGIIEGCIVDGLIDITDECLEPEEVSLLLETLTATSFNFLSANEVSGVKMLEVQARATAATELFGTELGSAKGEAFVGLGSLIVETIRLIKDEDGTPVIQDLD